MKKTINEMTVKELKKYIGKLTKKANTRLNRVSKKKQTSKAVQEEINILKKKGYIGKSNKAIKNFRGKRKEDLKAQARELEYFNQWKGTETKEVRDTTNLKKYQTFKEKNPEFGDYSYQEWRDLVEIFGSTEDFLKSFGYEDVKQLHREATEKNSTIDFASAMRKIIHENKGAGLTQEDAIDILRSEVFK